MYKGGGGRCCHNCIQRNVECGEFCEGGRLGGEADLDGNLKLISTQDPAGAESGRCQDGEYVVGVSTFCFLSLAARRVASAQNGMG